MIRTAIFGMAIGSMALLTGCTHTYRLNDDPLATPAYSSRERFQQWQRTTDMDFKEMNEDIDFVLLIDVPSTMTIWNVK